MIPASAGAVSSLWPSVGIRRSSLVALVLAATGCDGTAVPPEPPPSYPIPPPPARRPHQQPSRGPGADAGVALAADGGVDGSAAAGGPVEPPIPGDGGVAGPPSPTLSIVVDPPYKLGERPPPKSRPEYQQDILDRRHWNDGGLGDLTGDLPEPEGHPDPRVIVNIDKATGPRKAKGLQTTARKRLWKPIIQCYRLGAYKDPDLRGWTKVRFTVNGAGRVSRPRMLDTELGDTAVAACMVDELKKLRFAPARRRSSVWIAMRVGPGDDPLPPPDDLIVPGDGTLPGEAMRQGVEAGIGAFEACYRSALPYAPGLWGRLVVRYHVTKQGAVDEAFETESRFPDPRTRQCLLRAARKLTFPTPKGGDIRFVVPLRLSSNQADTSRPEAEPAERPE
ncbi:MAG: AgmX/PglI C-terminal domain-containing protein [Deltaproteobacteria bacterium]|nr:AgmX/PglI C-terminal domain-containing protein [Deltaproteobacteria bacterium]